MNDQCWNIHVTVTQAGRQTDCFLACSTWSARWHALKLKTWAMTSFAPQPLLRLVRKTTVGAVGRIWLSASCSKLHAGVLVPSQERVYRRHQFDYNTEFCYLRSSSPPWGTIVVLSSPTAAPSLFLRWHSTPSITFFPSVHRGVQCFEAPGVSRKTEVEALKTSDESLWKCHVSVFGSFNCFCAGVVLISVRERWTVAGWHMPVGMPHSNVHGNVVAKASSVVAFVCHGSHFVDVCVPDICRRKSKTLFKLNRLTLSKTRGRRERTDTDNVRGEESPRKNTF